MITVMADNGGASVRTWAKQAEDLEKLTPKGRRTRGKLLDGARRAFERSGSYVETRITDIAHEAQIAYGTFYTYFDSKEQLFYELAAGVVHEMYLSGVRAERTGDDFERIMASNRSWMDSYRRHATMVTIMEQAASLHPEFRVLRRRLREELVGVVEQWLEQMIARGSADPRLDPRVAAHALISMADNFAYVWFVLGEEFEEETAVRTLSAIWASVLGVPSSVPSGVPGGLTVASPGSPG